MEYIHLDTFREAIGAHIAHLRNMGQQVSLTLFVMVMYCSVICGVVVVNR